MKKAVGKFIYDFVIKYIDYLDDETYDRLIQRVYRPAWTRRVPLPKATGETFRMYWYKSD